MSITREHRKVLAGSMVGTTIEWFDFFIYAQAAGMIFATQYFDPAANSVPALAQVVSWASIGISFLFRPLGAILAGHIGDRFGRKIILVFTLLGMGGATMLMGLLPNYHSIGLAAPILLVCLRILQGLSAGGEWGGAAMLAVEHAPRHRRGYFGAFPQIGVPVGMLLATLFMLILSTVLTQEQFDAWGWRIPFLSSVVLIIIGFWIRSLVEESPVFSELQKLQQESSAPLNELMRSSKRLVFIAALIFAGCNAAGYLAIAFFSNYGTKTLQMPRSEVLFLTFICSIAWVFGTLGAGWICDGIGRVRTFVIGYIAMMVWAIPMWLLIDTARFWPFLFSVTVLGILLGVTYGPQPALYAEMFPAAVRLSGVSIGYAIGSIIGGAFAPMIAQILLNSTGTSIAIGIYILLISLLSLYGVTRVNPKIERQSLH
ncbi:MFS transporter [Corynebacterium poyangense]|uniref:MFS transporter n=1 Tax=Corynebacterium poyangense TaxID=2684405 RepID=A0A7H0SRW2_9CORY|nr:MFS transporter [Corynebacterium poyangense]QNQ91287.1 MFS transporter [Corynebacterium poyangense]